MLKHVDSMTAAVLSAALLAASSFSVYGLSHDPTVLQSVSVAGGVVSFVLGASLASFVTIRSGVISPEGGIAYSGMLLGLILMTLASKDETAFLAAAAGLFASLIVAVAASNGIFAKRPQVSGEHFEDAVDERPDQGGATSPGKDDAGDDHSGGP